MFGSVDGHYGDFMSMYIKDPIETTITDEARRDLALKELGSIKDEIKDFNKNVLQDIKQLNNLVKDYDSKPEDFDSMYSSILANNKKNLDDVWKLRSAMLTHIHVDEWQTIINSAKAKEEKETNKK
jgi:hypothetical protein